MSLYSACALSYEMCVSIYIFVSMILIRVCAFSCEMRVFNVHMSARMYVYMCVCIEL